MPPGNRCSTAKSAERAEHYIGMTNLNGIQKTQLATVWVVEVIVPERERLERVHERTIVTVRGGGDKAAEADIVSARLGYECRDTYRRTIQAWRMMRRLLLYHVRVGSTNWRYPSAVAPPATAPAPIVKSGIRRRAVTGRTSRSWRNREEATCVFIPT